MGRAATSQPVALSLWLPRPSDFLRLWKKIRVNPETGCWDWLGGSVTVWGYGQFHILGHPYQAHNVVYTLYVGPVPGGLELDHTCRNRRCVNPGHLEPVTQLVNILRGSSPAALNAVKTHCKRGHVLSGENLRVKRGRRGVLRVCRTCANAESARRWAVFARLHPGANRNAHWQGRKHTATCPACQAFLVELATCAS